MMAAGRYVYRGRVEATHVDLYDLIAAAIGDSAPGAAVSVRHGDSVATACHGLADREWLCPVTPTTVFRLASLSKPFTALTVLLLEQDGLIDLDTPVRAYLPDYPRHADAVHIRHLLTHTSGIPNFVMLPGFLDRTARLDHTDETMRALFESLPLEFEPASRYAYSNSGYRLLDMVVAGVTGAPFAEVLAERVFAPAGMTNTRMLTDTAIVAERARGYTPSLDGFVNADHISMTIPGGAGGIGSTIEDLQRFERSLFDGTLASAELRDRIFSPVRLTCGRSEGYGFGWVTGAYRGMRTVGHAGGIQGFSTLMVCVPEHDASVIVLANNEAFQCGPVIRTVLDAILPAAPGDGVAAIAGEPAPGALADRIGVYRDGVFAIEVTVDGPRLVAAYGNRTYRLRPTAGATRFVAEDDAEVTVTFHDDAAVTLAYPFDWVTGYRAEAATA